MASPNGVIYSSVKLPHSTKGSINQGVIQQKQGDGYLLVLKPKFFNKGLWPLGGKRKKVIGFRRTYLVCQSTETHSTDTKERVRCYNDFSHVSRYVWPSNDSLVLEVIRNDKVFSIQICSFSNSTIMNVYRSVSMHHIVLGLTM